jgi:hypothetical protein
MISRSEGRTRRPGTHDDDSYVFSMRAITRIEGRGAWIASSPRTIRFILDLYHYELSDRDLDQAAFIVAQTMESLTHSSVLHHPDCLSDTRLANEITDLLVKYLGVE